VPPGKYNLGDCKINVTEITVTLTDGTLAGSNVTRQKSLHNLRAWTGCSLYEAVLTLTTTPAELLNLPNKGRISIGADADLVLITPEFEIKATVVGGEVLFKDF
jgi:N-acetylglucosamine-6-phosphate deacetylase